MPMSLRATACKVALVVLVGGGLAAGVAMASSAGARPTAAPPVDHQLCYSATGAFKIPPGVRLINQFSPNGFVPKINPKVVWHCNPVQKTLPSGKSFPITNRIAHLACFTITSPKAQQNHNVVVSNQFGSATLVTGQPNLLCVPSWKSLTGPPKKQPTTPPGLNHFTCYSVKVAKGAYKPPTVMLKDEFTKKAVTATVNRTPTQLCLPTEKIVGGNTFKIINPAMHLLCYPVTKTPVMPTVWDENQFGTSKLSVRVTNTLCVPSIKRVITSAGRAIK
ncbi:MAG TPA: hypothetical protein VFB39_18575 [Solirubrobacteraceae bacterium]|nr:hypothetical protein [Solirubrobacteraceae bacterium]